MKSFLKKLVKLIIYRPKGAVIGADSWVLLPRWFYNAKKISIGKNCFIGRFAVFHPILNYGEQSCAGKIIIGDDVYIGGFSQIHAMGQLSIGDGCVLSEHVYISDIAHGLHPDRGLIMKQPLESKGPVTIGRNVFIGYGSSVLPGVTLGDHCVVGTHTVVTKSFPSYSMIAGMPAKLIKIFNKNTGSWIPVDNEV
jgi:acetyltransferase-like isoleucine patch superfamily enzyme